MNYAEAVAAYDRIKAALEDVPNGESILIDEDWYRFALESARAPMTPTARCRTVLDDIRDQILDLEKRGARPTTVFLSPRAWEEFKSATRDDFDYIYQDIEYEPLPPAGISFLGCMVKPMPDVAVTADQR